MLTRWLLFLSFFLTACAVSVPEEVFQYTVQDIVKTLREIYAVDPDIVPVRIENFQFIDKDYYADLTAELERAGFRKAGDLEFKHLTRHDLSMETCVRTFIHSEEPITAAIWHLHKGSKIPRDMKGLEFETEFSDGGWLATYNHRWSAMRPDPEHVVLQSLPRGSVNDLLRLHRDGLRARAQSHPAAAPVKVLTLSELIRQQEKQALQEREYRRRIHGLTEDELRTLGKGTGIPGKDMQRLLKEVQRRYSAS